MWYLDLAKRMTDPSPVEKFAKTELAAFKRTLEVVLSEMGIEGMVPGAYDLFSEFTYAVYREQDKARQWLKNQSK